MELGQKCSVWQKFVKHNKLYYLIYHLQVSRHVYIARRQVPINPMGSILTKTEDSYYSDPLLQVS